MKHWNGDLSGCTTTRYQTGRIHIMPARDTDRERPCRHCGDAVWSHNGRLDLCLYCAMYLFDDTLPGPDEVTPAEGPDAEPVEDDWTDDPVAAGMVA